MPLTVEDLARTALVRVLPRGRFRLAGQTDARFAGFAANTSRIAYRQQGGTPAFLLFSGPGQDPIAAATAAAAWAEANWRPNAVQRAVRPGVVVVQVAPAVELRTPGPVPATAVPAALWTVDSDTGRVQVSGNPPGSPSGSEIRRAAESLLRGVPAPSLGELDLAERSVMQLRTVTMPRYLSGAAGILLLLFALRFGLGAVFGLLALPAELAAVSASPGAGALTIVLVVELVVDLLLVAGIALGVGLLFNIRNLAFSLPGFSSPAARTRSLTWTGYAAVMVVLAIAVEFGLPALDRSPTSGAQGPTTNVTATVDDDGGELVLASGGTLTVDLSGWPQSEWQGVAFKTSNPSVLVLQSQTSSGAPVARFTGGQSGVARVDASTADGRYTFQLRVDVSSP